MAGVLGTLGVLGPPLAAKQIESVSDPARTWIRFVTTDFVLEAIDKTNVRQSLAVSLDHCFLSLKLKSQAIPRMDLGRIGTSGVVVVSHAAQDKCLAGAFVNFFLTVMGDPVRVLQKIEKAAISLVVRRCSFCSCVPFILRACPVK